MANNLAGNEVSQGAWIVYINGLEIPVVSASTTFGVWMIPTLTLNLSPHQYLRRIGAEDRLQVAVFYLDYHWNWESPGFRLLFEYEVAGISYNSSPTGRFVQLNCVGHASILQQLRFFYISSVDDIVNSQAPQNATTPALTATKIMYPASLFYEGLTNTQTPVRRPIEFMLNIFRAILSPITGVAPTAGYTQPAAPATQGAPATPAAPLQSKAAEDVYDPTAQAPPQTFSTPVTGEDNPPDGAIPTNLSGTLPAAAASVPGRNFYARWFQMTGFHRRWAAFPVIDDVLTTGCFPLLKASQSTLILESLKDQVGTNSVGNAGSAWDLLQQVLGYMYMEVMALPAPPAVELDPDSHLVKSLYEVGKAVNPGIAAHYIKPACYFALPPTCNVLFPSQISSWGYSEDYRAQPTRVYLNETFCTNLLAGDKNGSSSKMFANLMVTGYPDSVRRRMRDMLQGTASVVSNAKNMLVFPEEFFIGPTAAQFSSPPWMYMMAQELKDQTRQSLLPSSDGGPRSPLELIFDDYARYEYYRSKYTARPGSVQTAGWNPYLVPGFPGIVFDREGCGFDLFVYYTNVTHNMDAKGTLSTSASFSFSRTLEEFAGIQGATTAAIQEEAREVTSKVEVPVRSPKDAEVPTPEGAVTYVRRGDKKIQIGGGATVNMAEFSKNIGRAPAGQQMDPELIDMLVHISKGFPGKDIRVISGYRKGDSEHTRCRALDIDIPNVARETLWIYCYDAFQRHGVGFYPNSNHIHIDSRGKYARWVHDDGPGEHPSRPRKQPAVRALADSVRKGASVPKTKYTPSPDGSWEPSEDDGTNNVDGPAPGVGADGKPATFYYNPPVIRDMYPVEVIPEVANMFQDMTNAQDVYARLLYGGRLDRVAVFNWRKMLVAHNQFDREINLESESDQLDNTCTLSPTPASRPLYENRDLAMRYAARPACTLEEYIEIWHKGRSMATLRDEGIVRGEYTTYYSPVADNDRTRGSVFWGRIYRLLPGPGPHPDAPVTNTGPAPLYLPVKNFQFVDPSVNFPQSRDNWEWRLEQYRKIVRSDDRQLFPQK